VRIQRGLARFIGRRYRMLERARRIPPPPGELANQAIKIEFVSPFAKALKLANARGAMQLTQTALQAKEVWPDFADNYNGDAIARAIHDGISSDPALVNDPRDVAQRRAARNAAMQQQAQLEQAAQAASVYADVAHARQADTLAGKRRPRAAA
jgi:hypothetical protein